MLDPLPAWVMDLKLNLCLYHSPILCSVYNSSLSNEVMPSSQKHAMVLPRLNKPGMDQLSAKNLEQSLCTKGPCVGGVIIEITHRRPKHTCTVS